MPKFRVKDPDTGVELVLTGDSPPTEAELEQIFAEYSTPAPEAAVQGRIVPPENASQGLPEDNAIDRAIEGPSFIKELGSSAKDFFTGLMDEPEKVADGLLDPVYGAYQLGTNIGDTLRRALPDELETRVYGNTPFLGETTNEQMRARDEYLGGMSAERLLGNVVSGGAAIKSAPGILRNARDGLAVALSMPATSENFWMEKGGQGALGAFGGALGGLLQKAKWFMPGTDRASARDWLSTALERGGRNADDAIAALNSNTDDLATAGQVLSRGGQTRAAGSNEAVGVQGLAEKVMPTQYKDRFAQQAARRAQQLDDAFGGSDDIVSAVASRKATTGPMYSAAKEVEIPGDQELSKIIRDPLVSPHIKAAKDLLESELGIKIGGTVPKEHMSRFVHYLGRALKDAADNTSETSRLGPEMRRATTAARDKLLQWLDNANPQYAAARGKYSEMTRPIERMELGQALANKATAAIDEYGSFSSKPGTALATALREGQERLVKSSTGSTIKTVKQVLGDDGMKLIDDIAGELANNKSYKDMASSGAAAALEIGESGVAGVSMPRILERNVVILNHLLSKMGITTKQDTLEYLSEILLDPKATAELLGETTSTQAKAIDFLRRTLPTLSADAVSDAARTN